MSSHHVVRENQEPALLVFDPSAIDQELLGQLLEWSPIIITTDVHLPFFEARQIHVDVILADAKDRYDYLDSITLAVSDDLHQQIHVALDYLKSKNQFTFNLLVPASGDAVQAFFVEGFTASIFFANTKYIQTHSFEKWLAKGELLELQDRSEGISIPRLKALGNGEFEVTEDGFVSVRLPAGESFIIGQRL